MILAATRGSQTNSGPRMTHMDQTWRHLALTNSFAGAFDVEYMTNFADWFSLGPAPPRYVFTDTNAPTTPERYYRLRWP